MEDNTYFDSLLYLTHLIVYADGVFDDTEKSAIKYICQQEGIDDTYYQNFLAIAKGLKEKEMYQRGTSLVEECSENEKLRIFIWLYKISEVDGKVHVKEVRFLLYSIKKAGIDFEEVKEEAHRLPQIEV